MNRLDGRIALVAGVENRVGDAVAERFERAGARVHAVREDSNEALTWQAVFERCHAERGALPGIVVNARHQVARGSILETTGTDFAARFAALGTGNWTVQQQAILALRRAGGGVLVNVLSVLARVAAADCAALCAAARGMLMSTKSAALECARARDGIIVSAVLAGRIDGDPQHWPDGTLLPRAAPVTAAEVADAVLFLATDGAAYMTGVELPVDGGFLAS